MSVADSVIEDASGARHALQIAFQTMQERCQQLQKRLAIVEEENMGLRVERGSENSVKLMRECGNDENVAVADLQKRVEELTKQKSQLTHHVFMVAAENRQLWNRLSRLTRTNKNLGNRLIKISDTLKQHPGSQQTDALTHSFKNVPAELEKKESNKFEQTMETGNREPSLEEISLRLINSIMMEKSELEQQCTEMVEMQNGADINLQNIGFTYPEESDIDSLQQLKQHDLRLSQTKETLSNQQARLKRAIRSLKKMKRGTACTNCRQNASKTTRQIGTQFDSDDSSREHGATQTSLSPSKELCFVDNDVPTGQNVCPLCGGNFGKATFETFHEHVIGHFTKERSLESFEIVP